MLLRCIGLGLLAACLAGCGLLYTHITVPLDLNLDETPEQPSKGRSDWLAFQYVVRFDWNTAAIVDAAREAGLDEIYFADMEIFSVFFGIWQQRTATVYGAGK